MSWHQYPAIMRSKNGNCVLWFPDFPDCKPICETEQNMISFAEKRLAVHLRAKKAQLESLPDPTPVEEIHLEPDEQVVTIVCNRERFLEEGFPPLCDYEYIPLNPWCRALYRNHRGDIRCAFIKYLDQYLNDERQEIPFETWDGFVEGFCASRYSAALKIFSLISEWEEQTDIKPSYIETLKMSLRDIAEECEMSVDELKTQLASQAFTEWLSSRT